MLGLIIRGHKVLNSCQTLGHVKVAQRFIRLIGRRIFKYGNEKDVTDYYLLANKLTETYFKFKEQEKYNEQNENWYMDTQYR